MSTVARPALDPELGALLTDFPLIPRITPEILLQLRQIPTPPLEAVLMGRAVERREVTVPADDTGIPMTVLTPAQPVAAAPCVYWMHGGGMIMGDRLSQLDIPLEWLDAIGAVVVTVDYRLAPEHGGSTPVQDCYRGLRWIADHADELGIDPDRIVVAGTSAGGGLAAGVALMARDLGGPAIAAQILSCPMLDHRNTSTSSRQYSGRPTVWTGETNEFAWNAILTGLPDDRIPAYISPSRADDLSGLPPAYIDAGSAEVFRDEDVDYATRIWAAGGHAELHLWAGGFHGFDALFPQACLSAAARRARTEWLIRILSASDRDR
ncbi:alpha/beta hydrolase [Nocardia shimofusensis]|uniref:alpha/beta hydrolase n=1 Tax=Nocardia shimofusensis TaxID=228596 RepID=UPI0008319671|nr:alpha/beta hydrolase [Nocardia shimofusensis]